MEFHEKLQMLRKQRELTQEELAKNLHVSRTAISKWESGRGYPGIDSLKAIAKIFGVSLDQLLSGDELLDIAQEEHEQKQNYMLDLVFGLLDLSVALFLFLPIFGQFVAGAIQNVSLLFLTHIPVYLKIAYWVSVIAMAVFGLLTLVLQNCTKIFWVKNKRSISLICNILAVLLFELSAKPYAAVYLSVLMIIKAFLLIKRQ